MVALHYNAVGLEAPRSTAARRKLREEGDRRSARGGLADLTALIAGSAPAEEADTRSSSSPPGAAPAERYATVEAALARAARERAVLVWLDDVQWGGDSVAMVAHALEALEAPVLFVLTVREEALAEREREREQLEKLEAHARVIASRGSARWPKQDTGALVERLLGPERRSRGGGARRVEGNPLFAVQLVGDWVQRGMLQLTPRGFALRPGERAEIPDELGAVWADADRPDRARARATTSAPRWSSPRCSASRHDEDELGAVYAALGPPARATRCSRR